MPTEFANSFFAANMKGEIDFDNDTFKIILMQSGFTFDRDTMNNLADVSASELAAGNGYTAGGATLVVNTAVAEDDTNDRARVIYDNVVFTASGGSIGPTPGAILYDDTQASDVLVGYILFSQERTITDGNTLTITTPTIDNRQAA